MLRCNVTFYYRILRYNIRFFLRCNVTFFIGATTVNGHEPIAEMGRGRHRNLQIICAADEAATLALARMAVNMSEARKEASKREPMLWAGCRLRAQFVAHKR